MRVSETHILIVPGLAGAAEHHWQTRWESRLSTASRIVPPADETEESADWAKRIAAAVGESDRPTVIVAHAAGVAAAVEAVPFLTKPVVGAFFVAPVAAPSADGQAKEFSREPLPFPSIVVASRSDPNTSFEDAEDIAAAWGSLFIDAGESGHLDADSGHGPWPEGLLTFGKFLSRLPTA